MDDPLGAFLSVLASLGSALGAADVGGGAAVVAGWTAAVVGAAAVVAAKGAVTSLIILWRRPGVVDGYETDRRVVQSHRTWIHAHFSSILTCAGAAFVVGGGAAAVVGAGATAAGVVGVGAATAAGVVASLVPTSTVLPVALATSNARSIGVSWRMIGMFETRFLSIRAWSRWAIC